MSVSNSSVGIALLPFGDEILMTGGEKDLEKGSRSAPLNTAYAYNPTTNQWRKLPSMTVARSSHSISVLDDDRVITCGGNDGYEPPFRKRTPLLYIYINT